MDGVKAAATLAFVGGLALLLAVAVVLLFPAGAPTTPPAAEEEKPAIEITIIGGEIDGKFAFGIRGEDLSSPGPDIRVKVSETVKVTFINIGRIPHSFAVVSEKKFDAPVLFNAAIGSAARPVQPGEQGTTIFKPNKPGIYNYVCQVPGHIELGMYGNLIVEE
ncbi:MAG: plastocyanin/azurin family copper-binding protein [Aigarchaeota archaeon]|nr:plastocyanin/azurin family copper-binding protein [Candidatus Pelearchaeum maunauluense]